MLFRAMISPIMPTYFVCQNPLLWLRFKTAVVQHQLHCLKLLLEESFPYVSGARPFIMRHDAHKRFLKHVSTYRRKFVTVDQETLTLIHGFGLLDPSKTIDTDGFAKGKYHLFQLY
jgi:UDP-2,3-diacylglucosamine pyrophosphatase LpxH